MANTVNIVCPPLTGTRYCVRLKKTQPFHPGGKDAEDKGAGWGAVSLTFDENLQLCM